MKTNPIVIIARRIARGQPVEATPDERKQALQLIELNKEIWKALNIHGK